MKTIIIKESEWLRGKPLQGLLRDSETGRKCCLGFVCEARGITEINDITMPSGASENAQKRIQGLTTEDKDLKGFYNDTEFSSVAVKFNDALMDDEERKFWLKILAHDAGYDFQFVP